MYGYVVPIKENLTQADFCLYRAFYCGICKATGRGYGQIPRFTTNYDIVFLSLLLHDFTTQEVAFENKGCVCNPFKKKTTVCKNALLDRLVSANILLSYYKAADDVIDDGAKKKVVRGVLKRPYNKAKKELPEADALIAAQYQKLRALEKANCDGIDRVADCFAIILMRLAQIILGECADENLLKLCYNVGKFVYLADALDDIDEDFKKKHYNPFLAAYPDYTGRKSFFEKHQSELTFALSSAVNRAIECFNQIRFTQCGDLLKNIVHYGLRGKVNELFGSDKKLSKPRI